MPANYKLLFKIHVIQESKKRKKSESGISNLGIKKRRRYVGEHITRKFPSYPAADP